MTQRTQRVGDLIRSELSELLRREMSDPRVRLATISRVEVSADLRYARVGVSALGTEAERDEAVRALERAGGFLRHALAKRLTLRVAPELRFALDRGAEHSQQIEDLLHRATDGEGDGS